MPTMRSALLPGLLFFALIVLHDALARRVQIRLVEELSENVVASSGYRLSLLCRPDRPTSDSGVSWYKDDKPFRSSTSRVRAQRRYIHFKLAKPEDSGFYSCLVEQVGWRNVTLIIDPRAGTLGLDAETDDELGGLADSRVMPAETRVEAEIESNATQASIAPILQERLTPSSVLIPATGYHKDHHEDEHQQRDSDKRAMKLELLITQDALGPIDRNAENNVVANKILVKIGSTVNLACAVLPDTHGQQEWYHGLHTSIDSLDKSDDSSKIDVKAKGEWNDKVLEIRNVTKKDDGWYTCVVQNPMGYTFSSTYLVVHWRVNESVTKRGPVERIVLRLSFMILWPSVCLGMMYSVYRRRKRLVREWECQARMMNIILEKSTLMLTPGISFMAIKWDLNWNELRRQIFYLLFGLMVLLTIKRNF